ncbi:MAG: type II toxin-antitoxin system RelE/ParE family toxin [Sphingobacteriales bacterium]|nr:type II toxin-antitoxin system RelE/ParE family toxin [Sphingobacteriales bacterium]MBI3718751.1 type II toxin-antitoxin system RelE/ParE family toxin [Sphingobacteriales bacterium]
MAPKIIVAKRFRNNTYRVYQYILKEFSAPTAYNFIRRLERRIEFIANHPTTGKLSFKKKDVRSILFSPHNRIYYPYRNDTIEILCLFDMRKNPDKNQY